MGGLVACNFIRLHREIWEQMRQGNQSRGGRLIMLGTPNFGSFAIPQALTGVESLVQRGVIQNVRTYWRWWDVLQHRVAADVGEQDFAVRRDCHPNRLR